MLFITTAHTPGNILIAIIFAQEADYLGRNFGPGTNRHPVAIIHRSPTEKDPGKGITPDLEVD